jgi:ATP-dependent DNA ligase
MIERPGEALSVRRQCALLNLARSGIYRPKPATTADDLTLMRRIDELHLELPFCLPVLQEASKLGVEGDRLKAGRQALSAGQPRHVWVKSKILNRQEFVVVGWTDPEGSRASIGPLLLGYYRDDGKLIYTGRVGTGITQAELPGLLKRLHPLAAKSMTVDVPPPTIAGFGRPLELSCVHWVRPELAPK